MLRLSIPEIADYINEPLLNNTNKNKIDNEFLYDEVADKVKKKIHSILHNDFSNILLILISNLLQNISESGIDNNNDIN